MQPTSASQARGCFFCITMPTRSNPIRYLQVMLISRSDGALVVPQRNRQAVPVVRHLLLHDGSVQRDGALRVLPLHQQLLQLDLHRRLGLLGWWQPTQGLLESQHLLQKQ